MRSLARLSTIPEQLIPRICATLVDEKSHSEPSALLREAAADVLGNAGDKRAVTALSQCLAVESLEVRLACLRNLGACGTSAVSAVPTMISRIEYEAERDVALTAIGAIVQSVASGRCEEWLPTRHRTVKAVDVLQAACPEISAEALEVFDKAARGAWGLEYLPDVGDVIGVLGTEAGLAVFQEAFQVSTRRRWALAGFRELGTDAAPAAESVARDLGDDLSLERALVLRRLCPGAESAPYILRRAAAKQSDVYALLDVLRACGRRLPGALPALEALYWSPPAWEHTSHWRRAVSAALVAVDADGAGVAKLVESLKHRIESRGRQGMRQ
jgi:hypothetical protein